MALARPPPPPGAWAVRAGPGQLRAGPGHASPWPRVRGGAGAQPDPLRSLMLSPPRWLWGTGPPGPAPWAAGRAQPQEVPFCFLKPRVLGTFGSFEAPEVPGRAKAHGGHWRVTLGPPPCRPPGGRLPGSAPGEDPAPADEAPSSLLPHFMSLAAGLRPEKPRRGGEATCAVVVGKAPAGVTRWGGQGHRECGPRPQDPRVCTEHAHPTFHVRVGSVSWGIVEVAAPGGPGPPSLGPSRQAGTPQGEHPRSSRP